MTYSPNVEYHKSITADFTASAFVHYSIDTAGGAIVASLPSPTQRGQWLRLKLTDATNDVTLLPSSGTIDGQASRIMGNPQESLMLISDGVNNWEVV